jgi:predicted transcriptional regulator
LDLVLNKIQNKIRANITQSGNEECLKMLIDEYELKLKDHQKDKAQISKLQKQLFAERMRKQNEERLNKSIQELKRDEDDIEEGIIHWEGVGIINSLAKVSIYASLILSL